MGNNESSRPQEGDVQTRRDLRELYERIEKARETGRDGKDSLGTLIEKFRGLLNQTRREFIKTIQVSRSTYFRWLKGEIPPQFRIDGLKKFLSDETPEEAAQDSIFSGDRRLTLRPFSQVLDRQIRCKTCWVIKNALPYRSAAPGHSQNTLIKFLRDEKNQGDFNCVFFALNEQGPNPLSTYAARESFGEFKKKVYSLDKKAALKLRGWQISSQSLAFSLGLNNNYIGICIFEYNPDSTLGVRNLEYKEIDIMFEIPMAIYDRDDHERLRNGNESRWIELAPEIAKWEWRSKQPLLYKLANNEYPLEDAQEILTTREEIEAFIPQPYLPI